MAGASEASRWPELAALGVCSALGWAEAWSLEHRHWLGGFQSLTGFPWPAPRLCLAERNRIPPLPRKLKQNQLHYNGIDFFEEDASLVKMPRAEPICPPGAMGVGGPAGAG